MMWSNTFVFLTMLLVGIFNGMVYDIYRVFRWLCKPPRLIVNLLDLLFWALMSLSCFYVIFKVNYADIRFYIFIAIGLGWLLYLVSASKWVIKALKTSIVIVANICRKIIRFLWTTLNLRKK